MSARLIMLVAVTATALSCYGASGDAPVEYRRDVVPILSDRCFQCHGPDASSREAGLRLDNRVVAVDELGVIVPGHPELSELIRRIDTDDESEVMPPPSARKQPISRAERQALIRWIRQGAQFQTHWSFVSPVRALMPVVRNQEWVRQPIDFFVLARLDAEGLTPSSEADRYTLIRRLALDLTGLPPSADVVDAFVADKDPAAYEKLVERLLQSPRFGERMALDWLDAARYGDTNGYSIDGGRHMWLWRDWVIDAFNQNKPYDEFLVEQLAGDLLSNPTNAQRIATGFQRNAMVTHEAGTIDEENLTNYNADRVKTLGEAILGLTLGCAQCHDHKYDPISQRDYYRLFAYFNSLDEAGTGGDGGFNAPPVLQAKTVLRTDELPELDGQIRQLKRQLAQPNLDDLAAWEAVQRGKLAARGRDLELHTTKLLNINTPNSAEGFAIEGDRYVRISDPNETVAYEISLRLPEIGRPITGLRIVFLPDGHEAEGDLGFGLLQTPASEADEPSPRRTFVLTSFASSADGVVSDQINLTRLLRYRQVTASSWHEHHPPANVLSPRPNGWSPGQPDMDGAHLTLTFEEPLDSERTPYLSAQLNFGRGRKLVAARFEVFAVTGTDDGSPLPPDVIDILELPAASRSDSQQQQLRLYFSEHADATRPLRIKRANLEERRAVLTQDFPTMVMRESDRPRATHILTRGDYSQPADLVEPGTLSELPPLPAGAPPNRLGLAQWLVMRDHPLTSRVAVNRLWKLCFGAGLVRTPADFGAQGEFPTHPELLDWLATEFVDNGWNVKSLIRMIVTSATYRQSSVSSDDLLERDPENRLWARGPRFRLHGEFIRDAALRASGLLVHRLGGPSVNPYMPGDLWREVSHYGSTSATAQAFVQDHGEKLYRRSLYTYWKRTVPPPNMVVFDAPNRETCVVSRPTTNTPLQSLVLLNDVQFVEAARAFAERILKHSDDDKERLHWAMRECLSRPPSADEVKILQQVVNQQRRRYSTDTEAAQQFLANGESPRDTNLSSLEHAAWSQVAVLLLNLSESVTRN